MSRSKELEKENLSQVPFIDRRGVSGFLFIEWTTRGEGKEKAAPYLLLVLKRVKGASSAATTSLKRPTMATGWRRDARCRC